ncbi:MAG: trypsin-like peptidase domain-containing protein [Gammaproteobacteria bacterium]
MQDAKLLEERYQNSVFKVYTHSKEYDYMNPWQSPTQSASSGSGYVVEYEGKKCLLTNAHVVDGACLLEVRLADGADRYTARVKTVDHDCDIAVIEVDNPAFWQHVEALPLGEMPKMRQNVQVFGFPIGGEELCITDGAVSRIEVSSYVHSDVRLLQTQVSAPINPGNSGGPAISDGKIIGMAFQGSRAGEGLGYIIPPPIIEHFLRDYVSHDLYRGFPDLAFQYQTLESEPLRHYLKMEPEQTGIRVKQVDATSSVYGILEPGDVLLALDGVEIKNDATVEMDFSKRIHFMHLVNQKQIGDKISASLIRNGAPMTVDIPLSFRAYTTKYSQREFDKAPTFYIHGGLVFMPVTDNFISQCWGGGGLGKYLMKGKKEPGQEIILINKVLATESTRELLRHRGEILTEVNGVKINNLRDLIDALELNQGADHVLQTKRNNMIVFSNPTPKAREAILKEFDIQKDRSNDLREEPRYPIGCPEHGKSFLPRFSGFKSVSAPVLNSSSNSEQLSTATVPLAQDMKPSRLLM